eukprot:scaffold6905_cov62-Phaeocystis_antarctica.AAC.10
MAAHAALSGSTISRADASSSSKGQHRLEHRRAHVLERVRVVRSVAHARVEAATEVPRAGGQHDAVRLALDALGADGDVGEASVAPERDELRVVRLAAAEPELGCGRGGAGGAAGALARGHVCGGGRNGTESRTGKKQ